MTNTTTVYCYRLLGLDFDLLGSTIIMMDDEDDNSSLTSSVLPPLRGFTEDDAFIEETGRRLHQAQAEIAQLKASRSSGGSTTTTGTGGTGSIVVDGEPLEEEPLEEEPPQKKARKKKQPPKELPTQLLAFKCEHRHRLVIGEEMNPLDKENPGPFRVAQTITVGREGQASYKVFELDKLTSHQLRQLAINFGCKGGGSKTKFNCRRALAGRVDMGTAYDSAVNPASTANEKRINTLLRLINCCFLPRFRQRFLELNDTINRQKFETEGGTTNNPIKEFWNEISSTVNDPEEEDLSTILFCGEDEDAYLYKMVTENDIDPNIFNVGTGTTCRQNMSDLIKARGNIIVAMKESGHHCDDAVEYLRRTHLTVRKNTVMLAGPVYYLIKVAEEHPAVDQAFTQVLDK